MGSCKLKLVPILIPFLNKSLQDPKNFVLFSNLQTEKIPNQNINAYEIQTNIFKKVNTKLSTLKGIRGLIYT